MTDFGLQFSAHYEYSDIPDGIGLLNPPLQLSTSSRKLYEPPPLSRDSNSHPFLLSRALICWRRRSKMCRKEIPSPKAATRGAMTSGSFRPSPRRGAVSGRAHLHLSSVTPHYPFTYRTVNNKKKTLRVTVERWSVVVGISMFCPFKRYAKPFG